MDVIPTLVPVVPVAPVVPVLDVERIRITTPTSNHAGLVRYLLFKASALWPSAVAQDRKGEQYSHRGVCLPQNFSLLASHDGGASVKVAVHTDRIELTAGSDPAASRLVMEHLADDPIWGPTWLLPVTRYFAE